MTSEQLRAIALEAAQAMTNEDDGTDEWVVELCTRFLAAITEKADAVAYRSRMYPDKIYFASQCDDGFKRSNIPLFRHPAIEPAPQPTGPANYKDALIAELDERTDTLDCPTCHGTGRVEAKTAQRWNPTDTTPKDGTHILVRSWIDSDLPTVCHWFNGDWHLSVNRNGDDSEFQAAFWREI